MLKHKIKARWLQAIAVTLLFLPNAYAHDTPKPIALENGRILTVDGGVVFEKGTVLIKDEKIAAVGTDVKIPDDARRIDIAGMTVCPGLIDVRSKLWIPADSRTASGTTGSLNLSDVIDTYSEDWIEVAKQGVTSVCVQPSGSMGGRCVVLRVAGGHDAAHLTIEGTSGIQASLGAGTGSTTIRYGRYTSLKKTLEGVKKYQDEWKKYDEAVKKWEAEQKKKKKAGDKKGAAKKGDAAKPAEKKEDKKEDDKKPEAKKVPVIRIRGRDVPIDQIPPAVLEQLKKRGIKIPTTGDSKTATKTASSSSKSKDGKPKEPKKDKVKEVLVKLLERKLPLRIEVHSAYDATNALKLADEMKIDVVLEGLSNLGRTWKQINEQRPPLVAGPMLTWEGAPTRRTNWFSDVAASESVVAISTFSPSARGSRLLRTHAAVAVSQGLTTKNALAAITINAAKILGVDDKLGSIKVGKHADIAVFAGEPTDPAAPVMLTISQGQVTYEAKGKLSAVGSHRTELSGLPPELPSTYALKSTQVQKVDGTFGKATIVVRDGKVASLNAAREDKDIPEYDLGDAVITPGLVVGHAPGSTATSIDPITAHTHAADNYNPESEGLRQLSKAGFTAVAYAPESSNVVAGQIGCVRFGADQAVAMNGTVPHTVAGKFVLSAASRSTNRFPSALTGQVDLLTRYFAGEDSNSRLFVPGPIEAAMDKQAAGLLAALKSGEMIAVFEAQTDAEVRAALDLIEVNKLKAVLLHPRDFVGSMDRIKSLGVGIIAEAMQAADYDWYAADLAAASKAGVPMAFSATSPDGIRGTAAMLVNAGMSPTAALKSLTSDASRICGLSNTGVIAPGKPADLVVWTGSPIDIGARAAHVIIDGRVMKETP